MKNLNIHLSNVGLISNLLIKLRKSGVNINEILSKSKIHNFDLNNSSTYIPTPLLIDFLYDLKTKQGVESISSQFNECFKITNIGNYGNTLTNSTNVLHTLRNAIKYVKTLSTCFAHTFEVNGNKVKFSFFIDNLQNINSNIHNNISIVPLLDGIKMAHKNNEEPCEIGLTFDADHPLNALLPKGNYPIYHNQPYCYVIIEANVLINKITDSNKNIENIHISNPNISITSKIEALLNSKINYGNKMTRNDISDFFNVSTRSINRYLINEGTSFREINERVNFTKSIELLQNPNYSISDISDCLSYNHTSNFIRTFKR